MAMTPPPKRTEPPALPREDAMLEQAAQSLREHVDQRWVEISDRVLSRARFMIQYYALSAARNSAASSLGTGSSGHSLARSSNRRAAALRSPSIDRYAAM